MNILLTGGTGYIGSHTAVELLQNGYDVVIADNLSGSSKNVVDHIEQITGKRPKFYCADVSEWSVLQNVFAENRIDAVIHFAGYKSPAESMCEPLAYYRNNINTTLTLVETMQKFGCEKLVFSSSASVYGDACPVPCSEDMPAGDCKSPYARTKYIIEEFLGDICNADPQFSVAVLRYFNPIGAHESGLIGDDPVGVPNNLMPYIAQVASGKREKLFVFGNDYDTPDGTGVRDYIHITDLARAHVSAVEYAANHRGREIFNVGTGKGHSVLELIAAFEKATGIKIPYEITDRRDGDVATSFADASKAEKLLKWRAELTLEDMCRGAWAFQRHMDKQ